MASLPAENTDPWFTAFQDSWNQLATEIAAGDTNALNTAKAYADTIGAQDQLYTDSHVASANAALLAAFVANNITDATTLGKNIIKASTAGAVLALLGIDLTVFITALTPSIRLGLYTSLPVSGMVTGDLAVIMTAP